MTTVKIHVIILCMKMRSLILISGLALSMLFSGVHASEMAEDYIDMAASYCVKGNYKEAVNYLNKILIIEPNNKDVRELKATLEVIQNPAAKSYLTNNNPQLRQAFAYKKEGNKAKELSSLIAAASANNYWAAYFLAEYYKDNYDYQNAITYYKKTIEIKPNFSQSYLGIALCQYETKNYTGTITTLNNYLKSNPKSDFAYALRAKSNLNLSLFSNAETDIITALALNEDISYKFLYGKILYHKGNFKAAKEKLEPLTNEFKTSELYKYLGLCDYALKNYPNALLNIDTAIILSDDDKSLNTKYNEIKSFMNKS